MEESVSLRDTARGIEDFFHITPKDIRTFSPLTLAYIGDDVYDLVVRTIVVENGNAPVNKIDRRCSKIVRATAQCKSMRAIEPLLTEEEAGVYRRGRNAHSYTKAKNASVEEYRVATGFEALLGYLYLTGQTERIFTLISEGIDALDK